MKIQKTNDGQISVDLFTPKTKRGQAIANAISLVVIFGTPVVMLGLWWWYQSTESAPVVVEPAITQPAPAETTNNPSGGMPISQKQQEAIARYTVALAATDGMSEWVQGVESGYADGQVNVQVTLYYLAQNKAVRLEVASILAEAWGGIYQPQVPERSHLNLVNSQGRSVGGHKAFSGALYVDD
ncbi:MAG: hypothetical protein ACR2FS_17950 [Phormidesmis sp.]